MVAKQQLAEYEINVTTVGDRIAAKKLDQIERKVLSAGDAANKSFGRASLVAANFGQALEDGAIGFQLNGIAGAARGAGNNVSYMLASVGGVQGALAGAAISVGALFLPKLLGMERQAVDTTRAVTSLNAALNAVSRNVNTSLQIRLDDAALDRSIKQVESREQGQTIIDKISAELEAEREKFNTLQRRQRTLSKDIGRAREEAINQVVRSLQEQQPAGFENLIRVLESAKADPGRFNNQKVVTVLNQAEGVIDGQFDRQQIANRIARFQQFINALNGVDTRESRIAVQALEKQLKKAEEAFANLNKQADIDAGNLWDSLRRQLQVITGQMTELQARRKELMERGTDPFLASLVAGAEARLKTLQEEKQQREKEARDEDQLVSKIEQSTSTPVSRLLDEFGDIEKAVATGKLSGEVAARAQQLAAAKYSDAVGRLESAGERPAQSQRLSIDQLSKQIQQAALQGQAAKQTNALLAAQTAQQKADAAKNQTVLKKIEKKTGQKLVFQ